jgi:hypothetical protein
LVLCGKSRENEPTFIILDAVDGIGIAWFVFDLPKKGIPDD